MSAAPVPIGRIREFVLDCPKPHELALFWCALLGGSPVEWYPGWVTLEPPPSGLRLSFQSSERPIAEAALRTHVDILVADLDDAHQRVLDVGGRYVAAHVSPRPGDDGRQVPWRVYEDPVGHQFCLVVR